MKVTLGVSLKNCFVYVSAFYPIISPLKFDVNFTLLNCYSFHLFGFTLCKYIWGEIGSFINCTSVRVSLLEGKK